MHYAIDEETREFLRSSERLRSFIDRLTTRTRTAVRLSEIWSSFAAAFKDLPEGPQRRLWLLTVLEELELTGRITLPVRHGKQWDRASDIPLPMIVRLVRDRVTVAAFDWKSHPWHPKLQWVLERRHISAEDVEFLLRVNQGLIEGWFSEQEPFKFRSLQLTGDEKRLTRLACSALFGPGKLSLDLLGCEKEVLPLAIARITAEPVMLLFENAASFMVARAVMLEASTARIGCLGYGAGNQVLKSVRYLAMVEPPLREVLYVGDLDGEGIQIASLLSRASRDVPIRPATRFHVAMFEAAASLGAANGWPAREDSGVGCCEEAFDFLASAVREQAKQLVRSNRRIPEEVISHSSMREVIREC